MNALATQQVLQIHQYIYKRGNVYQEKYPLNLIADFVKGCFCTIDFLTTEMAKINIQN